MMKAQEAMIVAMTTEKWLELELIQGISDPNLRKRILQECNPRLQDMIGIATRWQSAEDATAKFVVKTEASETNSEQDEASEEVHIIWNKGPVTSTTDCMRNPREEEEESTNGNQKSKNDTPTDTSISGNDGLVRQTSDYTTGKPLDQGPKMRNVRITPIANSYRQNFLQFSCDVHPDTGCMETVIARNMARRQKMSVTPVSRQLRRAKGRRWRGLTTFDIEYRGRTSRVEALLSASLEDGIFLGWTTLKNLISGTNEPIRHDDFNLTTELRYNVLEPEISHNHANAIRLEVLQRPEHRAYKPNKPCAGCGDEMSPHGREDCPNRGKRC